MAPEQPLRARAERCRRAASQSASEEGAWCDGWGAWRGGWRGVARAAAAEALGAALLVALPALQPRRAPPAERAALAAALVAMLVQCLEPVSGAMLNPCVTLAALARRRVGPGGALAALAAQLAGAAVGAALAAAAPTLPAADCSLYKAVCVEGLGGACLALANCAEWEPRRAAADRSWPLRVAVCVGALSLLAVEATGASFNPARSFGPALVAGRWDAHWVYWAGPLGGALAAAALWGSAAPQYAP